MYEYGYLPIPTGICVGFGYGYAMGTQPCSRPSGVTEAGPSPGARALTSVTPSDQEYFDNPDLPRASYIPNNIVNIGYCVNWYEIKKCAS